MNERDAHSPGGNSRLPEIGELVLTRGLQGGNSTTGLLEYRLAGIVTFRCLTLELPWKNNERNVSCIPTGTYWCHRTLNRMVGRRGMLVRETFEVMNVPGRSGILFHVGNSPHETEGCILPALALSRAVDFVLSSRKAFEHFLDATKGPDRIRLTIRD